MRPPELVLCAHGTDDPEGRVTVLHIAGAAARRLAGVPVHIAHVDVQEPRLGDVVDALVAAGRRVVVVPVLLTRGFHLDVDVAEVVTRHAGRVTSTGALGPHPALVDVLVDRLHEAGAPPAGPVVVAVAGSSRPAAAAVGRGVAASVQERWAGPVSVGFLSAALPAVADAVAAAREHGPVSVASYLIGPGFFQRRLAAAGGNVTSKPLGAHPRLVDVVVERYCAAAVTVWAA